MIERDYSYLHTFMTDMVHKIHECDDKPSWLLEDLSELYWSLEEEVRDELKLDLDSYLIAMRAGAEKEMRESLRRAIKECHDVGNYAFMIADKCRDLLREMDDEERSTA